MEIGRMLMSGDDKATSDKGTFNAWEEKQITDEMALERFKKNNKIEESISTSDFVYWLESLGYRKELA